MVNNVYKLDKKIFKNYYKACREIGIYCKCGVSAPAEKQALYQETLSILRSHLEENGIKMPASIYPYDKKDKRTHAYVEAIRDENGTILSNTRFPARNPDYVYKDYWHINKATHVYILWE